MACLHVGSAVHNGRRNDLTPDFCKGLTFDPFPANSQPATYSCTRAPSVLRTRLSAITSAPTCTGHWTSLTASATNSITYNYVTAHEPGDQPVGGGSPGLN